jgi:hypothetical protein
METTLWHDDPMPSGKYAGIPMKYVPAEYLLFIYEKRMIRNDVDTYVIDNYWTLKKERDLKCGSLRSNENDLKQCRT